jgi:uncharacterized MAPEG superfamily protein
MIDARSAEIVAATAAVLFFKILALSYVQVAVRYQSRSFSRPEDAALMGLAPRSEPDLAVRAADALRNEGENTPYFLALAMTYVLVGGPPLTLLGISLLYVTARLFQGYAQVRAMQPQRMIGYLAGVLATICMAACLALQVGF